MTKLSELLIVMNKLFKLMENSASYRYMFVKNKKKKKHIDRLPSSIKKFLLRKQHLVANITSTK